MITSSSLRIKTSMNECLFKLNLTFLGSFKALQKIVHGKAEKVSVPVNKQQVLPELFYYVWYGSAVWDSDDEAIVWQFLFLSSNLTWSIEKCCALLW